jgi:hypothetical protein
MVVSVWAGGQGLMADRCRHNTNPSGSKKAKKGDLLKS